MPSTLDTVDALAGAILAMRRAAPSERAVLVAITGIDASGKGTVADALTAELTHHGQRVARLTADWWLNLPSVRFDPADPPGGFYRNAIRFGEMFERAILPLRDRRRLDMEFDAAQETAEAFERRRLQFEEVDLVVLEGIFLLARALRSPYDISVWIDCSWETALERAVSRRQEGLSREETISAYERIYFPAQRLHIEIDNPIAAAAIVYRNDPRRLTGPTSARP